MRLPAIDFLYPYNIMATTLPPLPSPSVSGRSSPSSSPRAAVATTGVRARTSPPPPTAATPPPPPPSLSSPRTGNLPPRSVPASATTSSTWSLSALNRLIRKVLGDPTVRVRYLVELESSSIHPTYRLTLSSPSTSSSSSVEQSAPSLLPPSALLLMLSPRPHTKLLRIEQRSLQSEMRVCEMLREEEWATDATEEGKSELATDLATCVPRVLAYDFTPTTLRGTPFLLTTDTPGSTLSMLPAEQRQRLTGQLLPFTRSLSQRLTSTSFGPLSCSPKMVLQTTRSWQRAFNMLLEGALRDGEDLLVSLPYKAIRAAFVSLSSALDEVRTARLVLLNLGAEEGQTGVVVDEKGERLAGFIGCGGWAVWADPLLADVFHDASDEAVKEMASSGSGVEESQISGATARRML
ncbi:MAG: hypothetical protein M1826_004989 [Phylliscum demangeonii]|nr:MAG: hypothetical protein M1826_004989 [Phylliscum demangeonii]